ncbi:AMP-binding protein [Catenovulum adriaticum]|uniref:AMP-binding protein n=1 Tax=Catenovulum adriaticum TaxID=2984846 RepID=A0ABY7AHV3_9ALTE|nr:AMP-binding protein [Catenovulum sp. TS8]WAJ69185.1 AMP-binding protein [Catenovulum sp. TS8]
MFTINDTFYSKLDVAKQQAAYLDYDLLNQQHAIAVCVEDNFIWLTLCFYLKSRKISAMPIHSGIPLDNAKKMAEKAGCGLLIYKDLTQMISLKSAVKKLSENHSIHAGIIQMSSGTTGEPKCILRSWADIDIEIDSYCRAFTAANSMTPVIACPVTHSYGLICGVMVALARDKMPKIITSINPKYLIKVLKNCDKPLLYSSPVMLQGLAKLWPKGDNLFAAMTSGSTMSGPVFEQIQLNVKHLYQQYGCSEAGCISISQHPKAANDLGVPLPHVQLEASHDINQPTEIIAHIETASGLKTIHTQDTGFINQNGDLHFVARLDDTIIVSGLNVYPNEIENIILTHPQITDCVVFKVSDTIAGQRIALQYVAMPEVEPAAIRAWCSQHLATFQVPQMVQPVKQVERMANSKVNRKQLAIAFNALPA